MKTLIRIGFAFFILSLTLLPAIARAQSVALSFDDGLNPSTQPMAGDWNAGILRGLSQNEVKAIFYVAGSRVASKEGLSLVENWSKDGHTISNHTYSHFNIGSTALGDFIADIKKNEALFENTEGWVKRLRFPYLKEGKSIEKRDGVRLWMADNGYQSGAVTIDTSDWYYNKRYLNWLEANPNEEPSKIKQAYLDHLWNRATYYDQLSQKLENRSVKHVMLLHTNAINSKFIGDVIKMFREKGWDIATPKEAYTDPIYREQPAVLPAGESLIWSIAKERGLPNLRYPAEDSVYEKPIIDALGL